LNGTINVFVLRRFITTAQQQNNCVAVPLKVQAITSAYVDTHLTHTITQKLMIAKIAKSERR
jgi:hypothetical protein